MCEATAASGFMQSTPTHSSPSTTGSRHTSGRGPNVSIDWMSYWKNSSNRRNTEMATTSSKTAVVTLPTDKQILITRDFNAPKDLVYRAYTTPELIKRWWSGDRGKVTIAEIDPRVGGKWRNSFATDDGS